MWRGGIMLRDVAYACRSLGRAPGLLTAVLVTLALGIGANAAVYSVVYTILLDPPPYHAPDRLSILWANMGAADLPRTQLAGPEVLDFQREATSLSGVAAIQGASAAITGGRAPEQVTLARTSPNFFDVLGVGVLAGRTFASTDGFPTPAPPVVLAWPLFQRRFGGDVSIIGQSLVLDGASVQIIGVLRPDFRLQFLAAARFASEPQVFQPITTDLAKGHRLIRPYHVIARLADDATRESAAVQMAAISAALARRDPIYHAARHTFHLAPMTAESTREVRPMLFALFAGVIVVLLVTCVNVGGLLLARAAGRQREIATLAALGADRARFARQFLVEGLIIAAAGAFAGLVTGMLVLRAIVALRPPGLDRLEQASLDPTVLGVVAAVAGVWGLLFALAPLAEVRRLNVSSCLGLQSRIAGRLRYRTRAALVVTQIVLGTILVVGAGLLLRSIDALYRVDAGFNLDTSALTFRVVWPAHRYATGDAVNAFDRELADRLRALPGVRQVGSISHIPFDTAGSLSGKYVTQAEDTPEGQAAARFADLRVVSPGVLEMLGAQLVAGRWFNDEDGRGGALVSIVDDKLAARAWPGQPAVGQRLRLPLEMDRRIGAHWTTVIGVVRHVRFRRLDAEVQEQAYVPARQTLRTGATAYVVRTESDPSSLAAAVTRVVSDLDPLLPPYDVRPLRTYVARAISARLFTVILASSFAFLALALAAVGLAGLVSYSVTSRVREFGVRLALGATSGGVQRLVLTEALLLVITGLGIGVLAATGASHAMRALLFSVSPLDAASYTGAIVLVAVVGLAASWWPARRAGRVNPVVALRAE
jgi:putative ABC transport system permease protein